MLSIWRIACEVARNIQKDLHSRRKTWREITFTINNQINEAGWSRNCPSFTSEKLADYPWNNSLKNENDFFFLPTGKSILDFYIGFQVSAWGTALLWFHSCWSQNPGSRGVWIFTLRSWIWARCSEKAVRHASEDRLNTEQLKAEWSDYSWSFARRQKDWTVKNNSAHVTTAWVYSCI